MAECELQGCKQKGAAKRAIGAFQVYDGDTPTLNRPALLCEGCVRFAQKCGMTPRLEGPAPEGRRGDGNG